MYRGAVKKTATFLAELLRRLPGTSATLALPVVGDGLQLEITEAPGPKAQLYGYHLDDNDLRQSCRDLVDAVCGQHAARLQAEGVTPERA